MPVDFRLEGDVAVLTLDRPEVFNSIDPEMSTVLRQQLARASTEAHAIILTGAGKAFCAGADLSDLKTEYEQGGPNLRAILEERFNPIIEALVTLPLPTVAAVNGACAGAGLGLALGCDIRVVSDTAYFMSAFSRVALIPDSGSTWFLSHFAGAGRALEMALTARKVGADEALSVGLASTVVSPDQLMSAAMETAQELATGPSGALVATRQLIHFSCSSTLAEALERETQEQARLGAAPEHLEGIRAFTEKRKPQFR